MTISFHRVATLAASSLLAFAVVACGSAAPAASTAPSSSPGSAAASTEPSAQPSPSAASSVGASVPVGSNGIPSIHEAPDLEAALPDQLGGETLRKLSFKGSGSLAAGTDSQDFQNLLGALGKSPDDFSLAVAGGQSGSVGAFRVAGTDGNALLNAFIDAAKKDDPTTQATDTSRGGKSVKKVVSGSDTTYAYASGDKVFFVQSDTDTLIDEALSKLP